MVAASLYTELLQYYFQFDLVGEYEIVLYHTTFRLAQS